MHIPRIKIVETVMPTIIDNGNKNKRYNIIFSMKLECIFLND